MRTPAQEKEESEEEGEVTTFQFAWTVAIIIGFGYCGWLCLFRTNKVVGWGRKNYARSKFAQSLPTASLVTKPWYPIYIRCAGVFIWLWAVFVFFVIAFHRIH
jgi:hypothetical protein